MLFRARGSDRWAYEYMFIFVGARHGNNQIVKSSINLRFYNRERNGQDEYRSVGARTIQVILIGGTRLNGTKDRLFLSSGLIT